MHSFFTVYDFMVEDLKLSGNDLLVFALIYSFTVGGGNACYASQSTIGGRIGAGRQTVNKCLKRLKERGLIETVAGGECGKTKHYVSAALTADVKKGDRYLSEKVTGACQKTRHNTKKDNQSKVYIHSGKPSFDLNKCEELLY